MISGPAGRSRCAYKIGRGFYDFPGPFKTEPRTAVARHPAGDKPFQMKPLLQRERKRDSQSNLLASYRLLLLFWPDAHITLKPPEKAHFSSSAQLLLPLPRSHSLPAVWQVNPFTGLWGPVFRPPTPCSSTRQSLALRETARGVGLDCSRRFLQNSDKRAVRSGEVTLEASSAGGDMICLIQQTSGNRILHLPVPKTSPKQSF